MSFCIFTYTHTPVSVFLLLFIEATGKAEDLTRTSIWVLSPGGYSSKAPQQQGFSPATFGHHLASLLHRPHGSGDDLKCSSKRKYTGALDVFQPVAFVFLPQNASQKSKCCTPI